MPNKITIAHKQATNRKERQKSSSVFHLHHCVKFKEKGIGFLFLVSCDNRKPYDKINFPSFVSRTPPANTSNKEIKRDQNETE